MAYYHVGWHCEGGKFCSYQLKTFKLLSPAVKYMKKIITGYPNRIGTIIKSRLKAFDINKKNFFSYYKPIIIHDNVMRSMGVMVDKRTAGRLYLISHVRYG